jgi:hypothetical protein
MPLPQQFKFSSLGDDNITRYIKVVTDPITTMKSLTLTTELDSASVRTHREMNPVESEYQFFTPVSGEDLYLNISLGSIAVAYTNSKNYIVSEISPGGPDSDFYITIGPDYLTSDPQNNLEPVSFRIASPQGNGQRWKFKSSSADISRAQKSGGL